jgi:hypothetical protein
VKNHSTLLLNFEVSKYSRIDNFKKIMALSLLNL